MRHKVTLYDTLGVERDATDQQIRDAFRKLALKHHPDRYSGGERVEAEARFQVITEAFNVLSHPDSRNKYDEEISAGTESKGMDPKEIARRLAAKGTQCFRDGNISEALEHLKLAIDHDDECARAHYFYGMTVGRIPRKRKDALRHLERASSLEPNNATMRAEAAAMALAAGMHARASRLAEEASKLDPTNERAAEVLIQVQTNSSEKSEGLLGRLRRRS